MLNRSCVLKSIANAFALRSIVALWGFAIVLSGIAANPVWAASTLEVSNSSVNFGNVAVGSNGAVSVNLKNAGRETIYFSQQALRAKDFSVIGLEVPRALGPGHVLTFIIKFSPTYAGLFAGSLEVTSSASNRVVNLSLKGTGVTKTSGALTGSLSATPGNVNFESVPVGTTDSQSIQLKNTGSTNVTISVLNLAGTGFKVSGIRLPYTLDAGRTVNLEAEFTPTRVAMDTAKLTIEGNSGHLVTTIGLSGSGVSTTQSLVSPSSLPFGNVAVGKTAILSLSVKNTGNSSVKISGISVAGTGYSATGISAGLTINPQSTAVLSVELTPKAVGSLPGAITITSNASDPKITVALSGTGISASVHDVVLNWMGSTSTAVEGYNVYRSNISGGPYSKIVTYPVSSTEYTDATVTAGLEYYYVVTTVNDEGVESIPSNQTAVTIP
jgi:hypothetical protein